MKGMNPIHQLFALGFLAAAIAPSAIGATRQPTASKPKGMDQEVLVLEIHEPVWTHDRKEMTARIFQSRASAKESYRLEISAPGEQTHRQGVTESAFVRARDSLMKVILTQEARKPQNRHANKKCQVASYEIALPLIHEKASICAGDHRGYFATRALISELLRQ